MMTQEIYTVGLYVNNTQETRELLDIGLKLYYTDVDARKLWTRASFTGALARILHSEIMRHYIEEKIDVDLECIATIENLRVVVINEFNKFEL